MRLDRAFNIGVLILLVALVVPAAASAEMYTRAQLDADRNRLTARLDELHRRLTLPAHLPAQAAWLADVTIVVDDVGPDGHPLGFASDGKRVFMPLAGLKFIEDLTMAYAWRYDAGRALEPIDEYLAMLRWKPAGDWPGGRPLDPLAALGAPPRIWERNRTVLELGTAFRNEAWAFILGHELAHVYYGHPGNAAVTPAESRANERQADAFALDLLERTGTIPLGAVLYVQATVAFYPSRADLPSDAAYGSWQRSVATHPVNASRLEAMARQLKAAAGRAADASNGAVLGFIAVRLGELAVILQEPAMQQLIVKRALDGDPAGLATR